VNPILALIITNIIWGGASPIFKFALQNIPPFTLAFIRFFFAGIIFLPFAVVHRQKLSRRQWLEILLVSFFGITINISFFFLGLKKTESINAPIIASAGPVFLYFLSLIVLKEKPRFKIFAGMLMALVGVLIIILSPIFLNNREFIFGEIEGNFFILIATLGAVFQTIVGKNLLKKVNPYLVSTASFLFGSLTFLPFVFSELSIWHFSQLNYQGWLGIIYGIFFSSAVAYFLYYYGMAKIAAQEVGIFTYIDPVVAVLIALPLLGEYPTFYFVLGSFLVFGGIFIAEGRIHWHPIHKLNIKYQKSNIKNQNG
jgi:drug/metabolite transporter (DMT)-like permease